jgi:hypothetical protein
MDYEEQELQEMDKMAQNIMDALLSNPEDDGLNLIVLIGAVGKIFQFMHQEYPQVRVPMNSLLRLLVEDFERIEKMELAELIESKELH